MSIEFRILGPVEAWENRRRVEIRRPKELLLLSVLLLHPNEVMPVDRLLDELWPVDAPDKPAQALQELVYQLRKKLESDRPRGSVVERVGDGYRINVSADALDLSRFERLVGEAERAKREGDLQLASLSLAEALAIWRGGPLSSLVLDPLTGAGAEVRRLEELRLAVLIERISLDLDLGDEGALIGELEKLITEHPLDERLRYLLMLSLYRAGRQGDALEAFQEARSKLDDELGVEPGRRLKELHQAILRQDPEIDRPSQESSRDGLPASRTTGDRTIVLAALDEADLDPLLALGEPMGRSQLARELLLLFVLEPDEPRLSLATVAVNEQRARLLERGQECRAVAFTSPTPADDIVRLANRENVDLLLMPCERGLRETGLPPPTTASVLAGAACDVGLLVAQPRTQGYREILVPFSGSTHDWASLELGAWVANAMELPLTLVGSRPRLDGAGRDASRLLADASLVAQMFVGVPADFHLVDPGPEQLIERSASGALLVVGLSERWRQEGLGRTRLELVTHADASVLLVRKGPRPGGLAPRDSTVFAWSLASVNSGQASLAGVKSK